MTALLLALLACRDARPPEPAAPPPAPAPAEPEGLPWAEGGEDYQGQSRVQHGPTELRILANQADASEMTYRYQLSREGAEPVVFEAQGRNLADMLSPDGAWLALTWGTCLDASGKCPAGAVQIYDVAQRASWFPGDGESPERGWAVGRFAWSPDGKRVAWTEDDGADSRLRVATLGEKRALSAKVSAHLETGSVGVATTPRWEGGALTLPVWPEMTDEAFQRWFEAGKPTWNLVRFDEELRPAGVVRTIDRQDAEL